MFLTKEQVKKIVQSAPEGTSPGGIVAGLRNNGYSLEGYDDTLKNTLVKKEPSLASKMSSGFNEIYHNYSQAPVIKQAGQAVGAAVAVPGAVIGGLTGFWGQTGIQTFNLFRGKEFDWRKIVDSTVETAKETSKFGYETGTEAVPMASLGLFGKGVHTAFGASMLYEGGKEYMNGIKMMEEAKTEGERNEGLERSFTGLITAVPGALGMVHATGQTFGNIKTGSIKGKAKAQFLEKGKIGTKVEQTKGIVGELKKDILLSPAVKAEASQSYRYLRYGKEKPPISSSIKNQVTSAVKPARKKRAAFQKDIEVVLNDLAEQNVGEIGIIDLQKYVQKEKARIWKDNESLIGEANTKKSIIDGDKIAKEIRELKDNVVLQTENVRYDRNAVTGALERIEFGELSKLEKLAKAYEGKEINFLDGESILEVKNAGLNSYYNKNPFLKALSQKTDIEMMADKAIAESIRRQQDVLINNKPLKKQWGSYRNVSEQINNRILALENLDLNSLSEKMAAGRQAAQVVFGAATGNPAAVMSGVADKLLTSYIKKLNTSDFKIRSATKKLSESYAKSKGISMAERSVEFIKKLAEKDVNMSKAEFIKELEKSSLSEINRRLILKSIEGEMEINLPELYLDIQRAILRDEKTKLLKGSETIEGISVDKSAIERSKKAVKEKEFKQSKSKKSSRKSIPKVAEGELIASQKAAGTYKSKKASLANRIKNKLPKIGMTVEDVTGGLRLDADVAVALKKAKGLSAKDIVAKHPDINLKRDVPVKDIHGKKSVIEKGEALTPYELKGNKVLLQDGETYIVSKNQYQNIKGQSIKGEAKPFAPELKGTEETIRGVAETKTTKQKRLAELVNALDERKLTPSEVIELDTLKNVDIKKQPTKFSEYQLPDGKNYKEILIKAPAKIKEPVIEIATSAKQDEFSRRTWDLFDSKGKKIGRVDGEDSASQAINEWNTKLNKPTRTEYVGDTFKSSHWDEPNVISHLRMNERTYKGKKVAFMEELQSDWAREGRDKGFVEDNSVIEAKRKALSKERNTVKSDSQRFSDINDELFALQESKGVPNNPLLKNWQEPTIKRALQDAVDSNAEYFAWINGKQTSARYNLSTHLEDVNWTSVKRPAISKEINLRPKNGNEIKIDINSEGRIVEAKQADWRGKQLDEVLGKGLADSIMSKETGTLSGEGLEFGGEWATNLYDKQVGNIVKDLTGGKVIEMDIGLEVKANVSPWHIVDRHGIDIKPSELKVGLNIFNEKRVGDYIITEVLGDGKFSAIKIKTLDSYIGDRKVSHKSAIDLMNEDNKREMIEIFDISTKTTTQQGIKLTPEIKAKIRGEAPAIKKASGREPFRTLDQKPKERTLGAAQIKPIIVNALIAGTTGVIAKLIQKKDIDKIYPEVKFEKSDELKELIKETNSEVEAVIFGETSNNKKEMQAIFNVIENRSKEEKKWIKEIVTNKSQFNAYKGKLYNKIKNKEVLKPSEKKRLTDIKDLLAQEKVEDITNGANMYYNSDIANPYWAKQLKNVVKIGKHTFGYLPNR